MSEILTQSPSLQSESDVEVARQTYLDNLKFLKEALSQDLSRDRLDLFTNYPPVKAKPRNLKSLRDGIDWVSAALNSQDFNPNRDKFRAHLVESLNASQQTSLLEGVNLALGTLNIPPIEKDELGEIESNHSPLAA